MSDPLTDYRRQASYPHPGEVDPHHQWRATLRWVRTVLAFLLGTASALVLASAAVLALGAVHVLSPDRPARAVPVLLSAPEVRTAVAEDIVTDIEQDGVPLAAPDRTELVRAVEEVLASPDLHEQLRDLRPVDGRIDGTAVAATFEAELLAQAESRPPRVRQVLQVSAQHVRLELAEEGSSGDATGLVESMTLLRRWALIAAAVLLVPGLVAGGLALAVARRRPLTAVLVPSGALLLAVLALAPGRFVLERLPGPLSIPGHVLAAIGELSGPGTVWALLLAVALPPALWWTVRSWRGGTSSPAT